MQRRADRVLKVASVRHLGTQVRKRSECVNDLAAALGRSLRLGERVERFGHLSVDQPDVVGYAEHFEQFSGSFVHLGEGDAGSIRFRYIDDAE